MRFAYQMLQKPESSRLARHRRISPVSWSLRLPLPHRHGNRGQQDQRADPGASAELSAPSALRRADLPRAGDRRTAEHLTKAVQSTGLTNGNHSYTSLGMKRNQLLALAWLSLPLTLPAEELAWRTWTDVSGRKIEAAMAGFDGREVRLVLRDGKSSAVPIIRFSDSDRAYVEEQAGKAAMSPSSQADVSGVKMAGWPTTVGLDEPPEVTVVQENEDTKVFHYQTAHFDFVADVRLGNAVVGDFGRFFEASYMAVDALPIGLRPAPGGENGRFRTEIYEDYDGFLKAGGTPNFTISVKSFPPRCLIRTKGLGLRKSGKRFIFDSDGEDACRALSYDVGLQCLGRLGAKVPPWFYTGFGNYLAAARYVKGRYIFTELRGDLGERLDRYRTNGQIPIASWNTLAQLSWEKYSDLVRNGPEWDEHGMRVSGTLASYFFFHVDGDGDAAHFRRFIDALDANMDTNEAVAKHLVRGRSDKEMDKELEKVARMARLR